MAKIKILFLSANPVGTNPLRLDEEVRAIAEKIRASEYRENLELISRPALRPDDFLQALLEHKPDIVHFSGHGSTSEELIVLDENGKPKPIGKQALSGLFRTLKDNVRVVLLNACYTRGQAEIIAGAIDCTIGINKPIGDKAAIVFAASFYRAIGFGRSVQEAFDLGKVALLLEGVHEENTPELMIRPGVNAGELVLIASVNASEAKSPTPTLILSSYEPDKTPDTTLEDDHFRYRSYAEGSALVIQPDVTYLNEIRSGRVIQPLDFWYSPWAQKFTFPALDIKLVNNSSRTAFFHEAVFRIKKSRLDPRPIPILREAGYYMSLPLTNIGWGPMRNCVLRFALTDSSSTDDFPFELGLGDVHNHPSLRHFFAQSGVNLEKLAALETVGGSWWGSERWIYFDKRSTFGEFFNDPDSVFRNCKRMRESDYEELRREALGPFPNGGALVVGELEYTQLDSEGCESRQTYNFSVPVSIFGPAPGAPRPPTYTYNVRLKVDADSYTVTVPISQSIGAGKVDRFLVYIATDKSSLHEFDVLLRYNETEEIISRPIKLELFLSRLDAEYVDKKVTQRRGPRHRA